MGNTGTAMEHASLIKAQISLEFILAFVMILGLFWGAISLWLRISNAMVRDTVSYQNSRVFDVYIETLPNGTRVPRANLTIPQDP